MTFGEGYEIGYSLIILDVLRRKHVPAVVFVTMNYAMRNPALIQRVITEGHVIGGHSVSHLAAGLPSLSLKWQLDEIRDIHEYAKKGLTI